MKKVILTKGLPASGKSTWAKKVVETSPNMYKRINKDDLRAMLDCSKWSEDSEKFIIKTRDQLILSALEQGKHIIVDDTNLAPKHEAHIKQLVKGLAEVEIKDFTDISLDECIRRDQKRQNYVGEKVIRQMYNQFLAPKPEIQFYCSLWPNAVICDLDGTLSLFEKEDETRSNYRSPYDASTCDNDLLNEVVYNIISKQENVLLVSGREDKYKEPTLRFLEQNNVKFTELIMRKSGDNRKDSIIKREIFENHIKGKYNIDFVLDDRNQVVEMWRSLGLTCLQVADGNF